MMKCLEFELTVCWMFAAVLVVSVNWCDSCLYTFSIYDYIRWNEIKIKLRSFKSSEYINEKGDGPYHSFGYLSLFSDPIDLATWRQRE